MTSLLHLRPGLAALAAIAFLAGCAPSSGPPVAASTNVSYDRALVQRGAELALIGNCASCHTAQGGKPYAGGRAMKTPFGTVYGTNLTPHRGTGLGSWSEAEFVRAMREGIDREGRHLYPAFPYPYFTHLADADLRALYAFLMTRAPAEKATPAPEMLVPRAAVALWNKMYLDRRPLGPDPRRSVEWNRGAYLVRSLAHCGACHSPRNTLGAEVKSRAFEGGDVESWDAPALDEHSPSPVPWTAAAMETYLRQGIVADHALTAGPMAGVVRNLAQAPEADVRAIAAYVVSLDERLPGARERRREEALAETVSERHGVVATDRARANGAAIYAQACAECHARGRDADGGAMPLALATGLTVPTPRNLIHITREGIIPAEHERKSWMPEFKSSLTEEQLADLVTYLRTLTSEPPWKDVPDEVRRLSREKAE